MARERQLLPLYALVVGFAVTAATAAIPEVHFAYASGRFHAVFETAAALIALLASYLSFGRFRERRELTDLLLALALAQFAVANLLFAVLPGTMSSDGHFAAWAAFAARFVGAAAFALAALTPPRKVARPRRAAAWLGLAAAVAVALPIALLALFSARLPAAVPAALEASASRSPELVGHWAILAGQAIVAMLFALAAVGLARRAAGQRDEMLVWLTAGAVLAAFASVQYLLYPSLYSNWVYSGDLLRLGFYGLVLGGSVREIGALRKARERAAVLEERRRLARDWHDGLAQELAYVAAEGRELALTADDDRRLAELAAAAERALFEARSAILALTEPTDLPLGAALSRTAQEVAMRTGAVVDLDLDDVGAAGATVEEALVRIAREALLNAARHSGAGRVRLQLWAAEGIHLRIADAGSGFRPDAVHEGFGLVSMAERAAAVGAHLDVSSRPGSGTRVEVLVPA